MNIKDKVLKVASLIDDGNTPYDALSMVGFDPEDEDQPVWGEDLGDECMDVSDPENHYLDFGWHDGVHYAIKRQFGKTDYVWEVQELRTITNYSEETP